jgi:hypothetical protein
MNSVSLLCEVFTARDFSSIISIFVKTAAFQSGKQKNRKGPSQASSVGGGKQSYCLSKKFPDEK